MVGLFRDPDHVTPSCVWSCGTSDLEIKFYSANNSFRLLSSRHLRDDDDINDVASMAGVNLNEESARILATSSELVGTKIRSCKDESFLPAGLLHRRVLDTGTLTCERRLWWRRKEASSHLQAQTGPAPSVRASPAAHHTCWNTVAHNCPEITRHKQYTAAALRISTHGRASSGLGALTASLRTIFVFCPQQRSWE